MFLPKSIVPYCNTKTDTYHPPDVLFKREQFDPAYLKLNPKAQVPTLVHDGEVIRE